MSLVLPVLLLGLTWTSHAQTVCSVSKYRSFDGRCNNARHTEWGAANTSFVRLLPPYYDSEPAATPSVKAVIGLATDGVSAGRHSYVTSLLPLWAELIRRDISDGYTNEAGVLLNSQTGFLDGSGLYGTTAEQAERLRGDGGKLNLTACSECRNVGSGLGLVHSTLLLEHNRLVSQLAALNPHWSSDTLYFEARRIIIAEVQHITFKEFLPTLLGEVVVSEWSLHPAERGRYSGYSSSIRAGTFYSVATSGLQIIPGMLPSTLKSRSDSQMRDSSSVEAVMAGMFSMVLNTPALLPALRDKDQWSRLLEESRQQKLPGYREWLKWCSERSNKSVTGAIPVEAQQMLSTLYRSPRQVDLLAGGILEQPQQGSVLGPVLTCLMANQFRMLRDSDRYWYENDIPPASLTNDQLTEVRKVTLAGLLCSNVPHLLSVQPRPFLQEDSYLNAQIGCDHFSPLAVEAWREDTQELDSAQEAVSMEMLKQAIRQAEDDVQRRFQTEYLLYTHKGGVDPKSPIGIAAAFSKPNKASFLLANTSILLEYASREIINNIGNKNRRRRQLDSGDNIIGFGSTLSDLPLKDFLSDIDVTSFLPSLTRHNIADDEVCNEEQGPCDPRSPYRSFSGHCNNLERPNLGRSVTTFARLLPSVYENGISSPRVTSVTGVALPSPRLVSSTVHPDISNLHSRYTLMVMQLAQFIDHDLTFTPVQRGFFASIPDCRSCDSPLTVHPECMPITIPTGDQFYPQINITSGARVCLPFMRSLPGQQRLGSREQINQNTAYLDGSQIYGQDSCMARGLRSYGGRLNATIRHNGDKDLLPLSPSHPECKAPSGYCFIAGDGRASEQAALTAIHTVYMREHNRLVHALHAVNPHWGDERLYQTARRIVVASYQHTVYNEFLPRLLGWNAINLYGLKLTPQGYSKTTYSSSCNPNIVTEFATAAFRIGHSLLRPHLPRMNSQYQPVEPAVLLRDVFFNPDIVHQRHMVDELIRGLVATPMENLDQFITGEITNHLFEDRRVPHSGMDLPALNVQRGRDHAIPSYNEYRALCNLKRATTWEDLSREIPAETIARFRRIYASVDDIDLFPGGLSERAVQGGLVGPTFACIIGLQFRQLKKCDRFWYESADPIVRFTEPQLVEIRKVVLAKTLCDNLDTQGTIQKSALDQPNDFLNPRVPCQSLPTIDVNAWRENAAQGCQIAGRTVPVGDTALPTPCTSCVCTAEGPQCASLRVHDCSQLMREAGRDAILRDEVCAAQCSSLLLSSPGPTLEAIEEVVSLTTRKPQSRARDFLPTRLIPPPPQPPRRPSLRSFKLPDILFG
ncbi:uncharacterized protein LOC129004994 [Macrosteles quadrilineatus]|uniref:uncharacterized protein LOC129004994 n=1 Tax=Macrosteles quadrilineatus TaxID=74068 RepID=UPI0023E1188F|nr:uncharacterized protein LOC129004994 [Macrosteles quadrilineatus]XP_054289705.1 uncharacterized protein LOC129004994 [Macrosteles quadrilineatus]